MLLALLAIVVGLVVLVWSADKFVSGASALATLMGMSPLLVGMLIVGFGTSAPEMMVSSLAAYQGNPGLSLGNAFGSNITNIALILGVSALIIPLSVQSNILKKELPILLGITLVAVGLVWDLYLSFNDALILLALFFVLIGWSLYANQRGGTDNLGLETADELQSHPLSTPKAWLCLVVGLLLLVGSSRLLVWGAVTIAQQFGVSDLIIGLTIVAIGTSLPELASSIMAARKGEYDLAVGNVIGSNLFNTLVVVALAGLIRPFAADPALLSRDIPLMLGLTLSLFVMGYGFGRTGKINRLEGAILVAVYCAYSGYLAYSVVA